MVLTVLLTMVMVNLTVDFQGISNAVIQTDSGDSGADSRLHLRADSGIYNYIDGGGVVTDGRANYRLYRRKTAPIAHTDLTSLLVDINPLGNISFDTNPGLGTPSGSAGFRIHNDRYNHSSDVVFEVLPVGSDGDGNVNINGKVNIDNDVQMLSGNIRFTDNSTDNLTANLTQCTFANGGLMEGALLNSLNNTNLVTLGNTTIRGNVSILDDIAETRHFSVSVETYLKDLVYGGRPQGNNNVGIVEFGAQELLLNASNTQVRQSQIRVDASGNPLWNDPYIRLDDSTGNWYYRNATGSAATFLTNAQAQSYIETNGLDGTGSITTTGELTVGDSAADNHQITGNLNVTGNVEVAGNLNYRNVEDLYVRDQKIVLNANAATDATVEIIANRPQAGANAFVKWNETSDRWEFSPDDGSTTYVMPRNTTDLTEGTNLYYTTDRANAAIGAYQGDIDTAGNITTSADLTANKYFGTTGNTTLTLGGSTVTSTEKFSSANTETSVFEVDGDGYALFGGNDFAGATESSYAGTDNLTYYEFEGTITSGDANITVSAIQEGSANAAATVSDLAVGYVTQGSLAAFPADAYVTAIDAGTGNVTMSKNAIVSQSIVYANNHSFSPGLVDTSTGLVMSVTSVLQATGTGSYTDIQNQNRRNFVYGYPQSGPSNLDFDIVAVGANTDYTINNLSQYTVARTSLTPANTVIKADNGITVGPNTDLTNRAENDSFKSFGINMMWDGETVATGSDRIQQAFNIKNYTDNGAQGVAGQLGSGAGRIFFTSANGKASDNPFDVYPREDQELGRLSWWGTTGTQLGPSSYNVPAYLSVHAADDWDTWGGGVAGNTNVYFAGSSNDASQTFLSYKDGELFLGTGSSKPITFGPAASVSGLRPHEAYAGSVTTWAEINYADTGNTSGAQLNITNRDSVGAGTVGDMNIALKRIDNSTTDVIDIGSIVSSTIIPGFPSIFFNRPIVSLVSEASKDGAFAGQTVTISASGTITTSSTGNESALGGNQYQLSYAFFNGSQGGAYFLVSSGVTVTYTSLGGTDPQTSVTQTVPSTATRIISSGVTGRNWELSLEEQSENLKITTETGGVTSTIVELTDNTSIFSNQVHFQNLTRTEILALTGMGAGATVFCTDSSPGPTLCFYDGSNWQKVNHATL